ncbi:hypothetical protein ACHAXR_005962 [Thalassiosira sp. AJA248-18]
MLEYATDSEEYRTAFCWTPDGRGFVIRNRDSLVELLPNFFSQTKYRSFTRQLNLWGFHRFSNDGWHHENFVRGSMEDLKNVNYTKVKGGTKGDGPIKSKLIRLRMKQHTEQKHTEQTGAAVLPARPSNASTSASISSLYTSAYASGSKGGGY